MAALNEQLIRDVVADVMSRIGAPAPVAAPAPATAPKQDFGCHGKNNGNGAPAVASRGGNNGVFQTAAEACEAAAASFTKLQQGGVAARRKVIDIVKKMCDANAQEWGRIELE